ncbi:MAG: hypothetical protein NTW19_06055 [Planctomycetota bacterium]|nr:hypothetical protein [Planctomycetota bacterium]
MADEVYFIRHRGQVSGPFTREQLWAKARINQISPVHSISTDQVSWAMAKSYPWVFNPPPPDLPVVVAEPSGNAKRSDTDDRHNPSEINSERWDANAPSADRLADDGVYVAEFQKASYRRIHPVAGILLALGSVVPFGAAGGFIVYAGIREHSHEMPGAGSSGEILFWFCLAVGIGCQAAGISMHFRHMFSAWKHVIHWNRINGMLTSVSSPDAAVGLTFIPFFGNFYWVFRLYGIGDDLNQLIDRGLVTHQRMPTWMSIVACISLFLSMPVIWVIGLLLLANGLVQAASAVCGILSFVSALVGWVFMIIYLLKIEKAFDHFAKTLGGVE